MKIHSYFQRPPAVLAPVTPGAVSRTKQEFLKESDVNTIMRQYIRTGSLPMTPERQAQYGDFSAYDFLEIQNLVARGSQEFEQLPSDIRSRFQNDPAKYFNFVATASADELRELGFLPPEAARSAATLPPPSPAPAAGVAAPIPAVSPAVSAPAGA